MPNSPKFKHYIWELPVRWCHWTNVASIVVLAVTGFFIGTPYNFASSASDFTMGWIRFIHFVFAYAFTISVISRVVWSFVGNQYASWREFFPFATVDGRVKMVKMLRYYMFLEKKVPETFGHNPMATTAYVVLFALYILMILTGFTLYSQYAPSGIMSRSLGFMSLLISNQGMRLVHHLSMWLIAGFVVNHVYSAVLMDIKEHDGEISSIFSGFKYRFKKHE
jgi:Ni/Fe-hydrogenase 1 B-type cytochrome subunit